MPVKTLLGNLRRRALGLSLAETSYQRRGFRGARPEMKERLERIGSAFLGGYHVALECGQPEEVARSLAALDLELQGFAFEGAAMGLALLDQLFPWNSTRINKFLQAAGAHHVYMVHVGVGWVWARWPLGIEPVRKRLDPLLGWLAFDGWGFHEGFFHWPKYVNAQPPPRRLAGYEKSVFDQGLGRSLWFVNGGNPVLIARTLAAFPPGRQKDLWSGLGLAAVYAGIVPKTDLIALRESAGSCWPALAQGVAFAAKARQRAGNPSEYTDLAVRSLAGISSVEAARLTDLALENLHTTSTMPAYEVWRQRIQRQFESSGPVSEPEDETLNPRAVSAPSCQRADRIPSGP